MKFLALIFVLSATLVSAEYSEEDCYDQPGGTPDSTYLPPTTALKAEGDYLIPEIRPGTLIWPVKTDNPDEITLMSFVDPSWDGNQRHTYDDHTGLDIGYPVVDKIMYEDNKANDLYGKVIAAAAGEVVEVVNDEADFCRKEYDPLAKKMVLVNDSDCGGGCAAGNCGGNYVVIDHDPDESLDLVNKVGYRFSTYMHLQKDDHHDLIPEVGDMVKQGEVIGKIGTSGNSTQPHLHFEMALLHEKF